MSWTGKEPMSAYTREGRRAYVKPKAAGITAAVSAGLAIPLIALAGPHLGTDPTPAGWAIAFIVGLVSMAMTLGLGSVAIAYGRREVKMRRYIASRRPWSIQVGPHAISTTHAGGKREFPWNQIQQVTIEQIHGDALYRHLGVHIQFRSNAQALISSVPAGWPYPWLSYPTTFTEMAEALQPNRGGLPRASHHEPICVLGPMTGGQWDALVAALTKHTILGYLEDHSALS